MKPHPFDALSFTFGAIFVALAATLLAGDVVTLVEARWVWPTLLIAVGAVLLLAPRRERPGVAPAPTVHAPAPTEAATPTDPPGTES